MGPHSNSPGALIRRERHQGRAFTEERPCEDIWRSQLSASQGETDLVGTLIVDIQSPEWWETKFFCLNHPVGSIFFWYPKLTNIAIEAILGNLVVTPRVMKSSGRF